MDPDMVPSGSTGQDPTMVPGDITGYSHQAVPQYPGVSNSTSLHYAHILLFLFLPFLHYSLAPLSTIYSIITPKAQRKLTC